MSVVTVKDSSGQAIIVPGGTVRLHVGGGTHSHGGFLSDLVERTEKANARARIVLGTYMFLTRLPESVRSAAIQLGVPLFPDGRGHVYKPGEDEVADSDGTTLMNPHVHPQVHG